MGGIGPRATPTISDQGLFAVGPQGMLVCLNPISGKEIWKRDLSRDATRTPPMWGFSSSPLIVDGMVIVHAGGKGDTGIFAYDATSGDIRWKAASGDHSYSSPQLATFYNQPGILMATNAGLQFLKVADGTTIWNHDWVVDNYRAIQSLVIGNEILFASSLGAGTRKLSISKSGDSWKVETVWNSRDLKPDFNDMVEYQGVVYGFDASIFGCISLATGKRLWKKGRYGTGQVVLLSDSGQLLIIAETGELVLVRANPKQLEEVARIPMIESKTWNHPIVVGNRVYARNSQEAACFEFATK